MKHQNNFLIYATNGEKGLDIYLSIGGIYYYLNSHRANGILWQNLKNGISFGELKRAKPKSDRTSQKYFHYTRQLLKVVEDYIRYELKCAS